jgi:hypothetical protein
MEKEAKQTSTSPARRDWRRWIGYQWLVDNMAYFLFLAALAIVYIYNGHYADKVSRDISHASGSLKELEYEYKTVKGDILLRSKESEVIKAVAPLGLKQLQEPPLQIITTDSTH